MGKKGRMKIVKISKICNLSRLLLVDFQGDQRQNQIDAKGCNAKAFKKIVYNSDRDHSHTIRKCKKDAWAKYIQNFPFEWC